MRVGILILDRSLNNCSSRKATKDLAVDHPAAFRHKLVNQPTVSQVVY